MARATIEIEFDDGTELRFVEVSAVPMLRLDPGAVVLAQGAFRVLVAACGLTITETAPAVPAETPAAEPVDTAPKADEKADARPRNGAAVK